MSDAATPEAAAPAIDLAALGFYDESEAADSAFARVLVLGHPKTGKTTSLVTTAPGPVAVINCDGDSALKYPAKLGAKFLGIDAGGLASWDKAQKIVKRAADAGAIRTVVLDSVTLLADNLLDELSLRGHSGFELFGELGDTLRTGVKRLMRLPCHVFLVAHMSPGTDTDAGVLPMIAGSSKVKIPALVHDVVRFDLDIETGKRTFAIGPQKNWSYAGRNVKRSCVVDGTVPAMFAELGIAP